MTPKAARTKAGTPFDKRMVGVKGKRKADFAREDDSGYENAQKQAELQHQNTAKRKMPGLDEWLLIPRMKACCHDTHI